MSLAQFTKVGRLSREIELKYTPSGTALAKTSIVFSEKYQDKENVCFIDVTAFGKTAETLNNYFQKGHRIEGVFKLVQESWTTNEGQNRSKHALVLERIGEFIEQKQQSQMNMQQQPKDVPVYQEQQNGYQQQVNVDMVNGNIDEEPIPFKQM